jgi:hypothetical protein
MPLEALRVALRVDEPLDEVGLVVVLGELEAVDAQPPQQGPQRAIADGDRRLLPRAHRRS